MHLHRSRLICYTRLCLNIAKGIEARYRIPGGHKSPVRPRKTHQLIVGRFGLMSTISEGSGVNLELISSLSSSLPSDAIGRLTQQGRTFKQGAIEERRGILNSLGGNYPRAMTHLRSQDPLISSNAGAGCAETINIAW